RAVRLARRVHRRAIDDLGWAWLRLDVRDPRARLAEDVHEPAESEQAEEGTDHADQEEDREQVDQGLPIRDEDRRQEVDDALEQLPDRVEHHRDASAISAVDPARS